MSYTDFKDLLFSQAKEYGFTDWEIYYSANENFTVKVFEGEISEYTNTNTTGLSFRGTYNGRIGYAFIEKLDETVIPSVLSNAASNASIIEEEEKLYPGDSIYPEANNPPLEDLGSSEKIDIALALEKHTLAQDSRIKSVDYCVVGTSSGTVRIANSYGLDVSQSSGLAYAYVVPRAEENGVVKTGIEIWHGNSLPQFSYKTLAETVAKRAISYLGAKSIKSGEYPVLFDNRTACSIMSAFSSVFFAESAQKGFSLLNGKQGEVIAAPHIILRDDGIYEGGFGNVPFDSEGVATKQKALIENGVLKTLLYNTKSAAKDGVASTGNGFKPSFQVTVRTACTNFYIVPSDISPEKMLANVTEISGNSEKTGVLITELSGLHAGINAVSGDFSIASDGFLVEDGKITHPVEQITVSGNFYSMLKDITCVGDDLLFSPPSGGGTYGMPSILIRSLSVSGL